MPRPERIPVTFGSVRLDDMIAMRAFRETWRASASWWKVRVREENTRAALADAYPFLSPSGEFDADAYTTEQDLG